MASFRPTWLAVTWFGLNSGPCSAKAASDTTINSNDIVGKWGLPFFSAAGGAAVQDSSTQDSGDFECDSEVSTWPAFKQEWCCTHRGHGCSDDRHSEIIVSTTSAGTHYDCVAGFAHWQTLWSEAKRQDCCTRFERGCEATTSTAVATTTVSAAAVQDKTSRTSTTTVSNVFDCHADVQDFEKGWSVDKKDWCCKTTGKACVSKESSALNARNATTSFNCLADSWLWEKGWSSAKKAWCCEKHGLGCEKYTSTTPRSSSTLAPTSAIPSSPVVDITTSLPYDCKHHAATWEEQWSNGKKAWCCLRDGRGCPQDYDCEAGKVGKWSSDKKLWCCKSKTRNCETDAKGRDSVVETTAALTSTSQPAPVTARTSLTSTSQPAPVTARTSLASTSQPAPVTARTSALPTSSVESTTTFLPYDCFVAYQQWQNLWSVPKQLWCCEHEQRACHETGHTQDQSAGYDCEEDFDSWLTKWDTAKRAWCCMNRPALAGHAMCFVSEGKFATPSFLARRTEKPFASSFSARIGEAPWMSFMAAGFSIAAYGALRAVRQRRSAVGQLVLGEGSALRGEAFGSELRNQERFSAMSGDNNNQGIAWVGRGQESGVRAMSHGQWNIKIRCMA
eukprot:CAMPEP_0203861864 /NCGR_PEP_ID=MMETSP0359-20131031/13258_1 /ASSEMBLY_ACC=CAM_ASM_000338 /TAXON_ID=268821 /ORGANISM="Scrippsiella Hangoei, Strain SHTV-5" /LENGTH=617 /DNA_ID=CAMNT_0050779169 /DNA_START=42 /DNA_END=1896 /DNA_ORIENTATION=+